MSSIEAVLPLTTEESAIAIAHTLFDEIIAPVAAEREAGYFPLAGEPEQATYFKQPSPPQLTAADFGFPGGGDPDGIINALVVHWAEQGDERLATSGPQLKEIIAALRAEAIESDGNVDPYCYTMF